MAAAQLPCARSEALQRNPCVLDFLIWQPIRGVLLHGAGDPVNVPPPEPFATPKPIVGCRRRRENDGTAESRKGGDRRHWDISDLA